MITCQQSINSFSCISKNYNVQLIASLPTFNGKLFCIHYGHKLKWCIMTSFGPHYKNRNKNANWKFLKHRGCEQKKQENLQIFLSPPYYPLGLQPNIQQAIAIVNCCCSVSCFAVKISSANLCYLIKLYEILIPLMLMVTQRKDIQFLYCCILESPVKKLLQTHPNLCTVLALRGEVMIKWWKGIKWYTQHSTIFLAVLISTAIKQV